MTSAAFNHVSIDPRFVSGEQTVGVSALLSGAAVEPAYHLAKLINLPHGVYNLKFLATDASVLRINGAQALSLGASTFVATQLYVQGGATRIDVQLAHLAAGANCGFMLTIYSPEKVIYASNAEGWGFDTTTPLDADLQAAGNPNALLPVLSVLPNWKEGITERIEYVTDALRSETGAVRTRTLREKPRRTFEMGYMRSGIARARLDAFLLGVGQAEFLLPLWHEQYRPLSGLTAGAPHIDLPSGTLAYREFRVGDLVIVTAGDPNNYDLLEVGALDPATDCITWATPPSRSWEPGCRLAPLRKATVSETGGIDNITDRVGEVQVRAAVMERDDGFDASWDYCAPLWSFPIDWSDKVRHDYERQTYTLDNQTSVPHIVDPGGRATVVTRVGALFVGRPAVVRLRRFIAAASGRAKRFWMPTLTSDVILKEAPSGEQLVIEPSGFGEYLKSEQSARILIGIVFADGAPTIYRYVQSVQVVGADVPPYRPTSEVLLLDRAVPEVLLSQVERVQFMMPVRFDQDGFELKHLVDESAAVQASFAMRSADIDGMPPIECGVTSHPYPLLAVDAVSTSAMILSGTMGGVPDLLHAVDATAVILSGSFPTTVAYSAYSMSPEAVDAAAVILSGSFPTTVAYSAYSMSPEAVDAAAVILSGSFPTTVAYIAMTLDTEAVNASAIIVSGALE